MMRVVLTFLLALPFFFYTGVGTFAQKDMGGDFSIALAEDHLDITTGFTGGSIVVFGHKDRMDDVILLIIEGPRRSVTVRKKTQVFGAWVNTAWVKFDNVPLYYDYAFVGLGDADGDESEEEDFSDLLKMVELKQLLQGGRDADAQGETPLKDYEDALIIQRQKQGYLPTEYTHVEYMDEGLFKVRMGMPANILKGEYTVIAKVVRKGKVIHEEQAQFKVGQVGLSARIHKFAEKESLLYALLCVLIAVLSGWLSNKIARRS